MRVTAMTMALLITGVLVGCGHKSGGDEGTDAGGPPTDACVGLQCNVVNCTPLNKPATSISGTVYAPNGTLPLYGVNVYIPNTDPGPLPDGAQCARCSDDLPGDPIVQTVTDESGHFFLGGIPSGDNIPVVITTGKWRRQLVIPRVESCAPHPLATTDTSLPKDRTQGDIPKIAITTGSADSLECLIRKLGIADTEITTDTDPNPGRVQLYVGHENGKDNLGFEAAKDHFLPGFAGGSGMFTDAQQLWGNVDKMKQYDIVMFSCEGSSFPDTKPQTAMDAVKAYADFGGRLFASHWHNIWIEGAYEDSYTQRPAVWADDPANPAIKGIGTWTNRKDELDNGVHSLIDEQANPKGPSFASWMTNVKGSTVRDQIDLQDQDAQYSTGRSTCSAVDPAKAERWVYLPPERGGGTQNFQFTTPNEQPDEALRCGKVVFSDMHVSGTSGPGEYPNSCGTSNELTPQEKALAFMFFDIASCVGVLL